MVGPNGSGKTTFVEQRLAPLLPGSPFVNADVIARDRWPNSAEEHSYEAARTAAALRSALIAQGESFIAETVFSHPSKLDLVEDARSAGYVIVLHVIMVPVEISVARVAVRVDEGGHAVPEDKIRERFDRLWDLVAQAVRRVDHATLYDNTDADVTRIVAKFVEGDAVHDIDWPTWTPSDLTRLPL